MYEKENSKKGQPAARSLRGQAAMEYLMTYGWAILIIVIVLAVLAFYLPQLLKPQETCMFTQWGFGCEKSAIYFNQSENVVRASFIFSNQQGQGIVLKRVVCTTMSASDVTREFIEGGSYSDIGGDVRMSAGSTKSMDIPCVDKDGNAIVLTPNSGFRGTVAIEYNYDPDSAPVPRTAVATLSGTVLG